MKLLVVIGQTPFDPTSGAAQATLHLAIFLAREGWEVRCISTSATEGDTPAALPSGRFHEHGVGFTILPVEPSLKHSWQRVIGDEYDEVYRKTLEEFLPDRLLTFGDEPADLRRIGWARDAGAKVIFALHNQHYLRRMPDGVDLFLCPSPFLKDCYRDSWGPEAPLAAVRTPIVRDRVVAENPDPIFVTFFNPQPAKGLSIMLTLADEICRNHPHIPLRIVAGRASIGDFLRAASDAGIDLGSFENIYLTESISDIREIWRHTRVLLMPSLWNEPAGRLPVEAMMNGAIPLVSDRGGLPFQIGNAGKVIPVPASCDPSSRKPSPVHHVRPWLDAILEFCEDGTHFSESQLRSLEEAEQFSETLLAPIYSQLFTNLSPD